MARAEQQTFLFFHKDTNVIIGCCSPLCDALVRPDDGGLDVDGVVTHPSEFHGFLQSTDHVQGIVALCGHEQISFQATMLRF